MAQSDIRSEAHANREPHSSAAFPSSSPDSKSSLEKIKRQLNAGSGNFRLEGALFKRSETLRKWNRRWFTLDPSTGKMDYRLSSSEVSSRGLITFDADSTITMSPINFHGAKKYDGCCFYVGTPQKKEYYLCADNQVIARAWVATLRASALVLKAHRDAVNSISGNGAAKLGTVAAVVAAANSVAKEAARDIDRETRASIQASLGDSLGKQSPEVADADLDNLSIMKETLRVKDEELHQLCRELRARDVTIKELADRLSDTANAADAAAAAAQSMDKERKAAKSEADRARKELDDRTKVIAVQLKATEERHKKLCNERDEAIFEAQRWQKELAKAREHMLLMEARICQGEQATRKALADMEELLKAKDAELASHKEKLFVEERPKEKAAMPAANEELQQTAAGEMLNHNLDEPQQRNVAVDTDSERATNPEEEQQHESVKSEVVQQPVFADSVPSEREVLVDTCSPEVDISAM